MEQDLPARDRELAGDSEEAADVDVWEEHGLVQDRAVAVSVRRVEPWCHISKEILVIMSSALNVVQIW